MTAPAPVRGLGTFDAAMVVVGSIVGAGAFVTSGAVAQHVASPGAFLAVWIAGGLLALCGALVNGELGALFPRGGGEYVYLRETYGPLFGFLSGWTSFWIGFPGSIATMASALGTALCGLAGFEGEAGPALVGTAAIGLLTVVNVLGLRPGKWTQNTFSLAKLAAFGVLIALGALFGSGHTAHFAPFFGGTESAGGLALALVPVSFAYLGWNAATYVAGEIRQPARSLGRALALGTVACVLLYLFLNAIYLYALPLPALAATKDVARLAAERLFDPQVAAGLAALVAVVVLSSLQASILTGPRIYQSMAEDGLFFAPLGRLHPRYRVPATGLAVQGTLSVVLLWSGTFERLLNFTTFAILLFAALTVAAVFVLRVRRPAAVRAYRTPGYPVTPALFLAGNAWVLWNVVASGAVEVLVGLGIVATGIPAYAWFRRRG